MQLLHPRTNRTIVSDLKIANTAISRAWGLLGRRDLPFSEALLLPKCAMVHMLFMRFPIDVVFCSKENVIVHISAELKPWRVSRWVPSANYVIELAAGVAEQNDLRVGDKLIIAEAAS